jgi:hypothetical protein
LFEEHVNQHMAALGLIPGMPTPPEGANPVTSGEAAANPESEVESNEQGMQQQQMMQQMTEGMPAPTGAEQGAVM